jgi:hypothetical protein
MMRYMKKSKIRIMGYMKKSTNNRNEEEYE